MFIKVKSMATKSLFEHMTEAHDYGEACFMVTVIAIGVLCLAIVLEKILRDTTTNIRHLDYKDTKADEDDDKALKRDPTHIFNKYSDFSKVIALFQVQDYKAIMELPNISELVSRLDIAHLFTDYNLKDPETEEFAIWLITNTDVEYPLYYKTSKRLIELFHQYWPEDKLMQRLNASCEWYNLIKISIKRHFARLLKKTVVLQYRDCAPVCRYINSHIYKLLTSETYFNPRIVCLYRNMLKHLNIQLDMTKFSKEQLAQLDECSASVEEDLYVCDIGALDDSESDSESESESESEINSEINTNPKTKSKND